MHRVPIKDLKQYEQALEVLTRVGGTFQGVGSEEWALLVSDAQFQALVDAKVVAAGNGAEARAHDPKSEKKAQPRGNDEATRG